MTIEILKMTIFDFYHNDLTPLPPLPVYIQQNHVQIKCFNKFNIIVSNTVQWIYIYTLFTHELKEKQKQSSSKPEVLLIFLS